MRIPRLYCTDRLRAGVEIKLNANTSNHLLHVLRLQLGAELIVFDGCGGEYQGTLSSVINYGAVVKVGKFIERNVESKIKIYLAQGISRGEKMDLTIQKAVELGVYKIFPLFTKRCNVKLGQEQQDKRKTRWQTIAIGACEQSGRTYVPTVEMPQNLHVWLPQVSFGTKLLLLHQAAYSLADLPFPATNDCVLLIGPEGGLADEELRLAQQFGFVAVKLGPRILRTETAALAAISALQTRWGDF